MARAKFSRAHLRARSICAQLPVLEKMAKNDIFEVLTIACSARGSARAPKKFSDSKTSSKLDAF